jgi:hypothetical protein
MHQHAAVQTPTVRYARASPARCVTLMPTLARKTARRSPSLWLTPKCVKPSGTGVASTPVASASQSSHGLDLGHHIWRTTALDGMLPSENDRIRAIQRS